MTDLAYRLVAIHLPRARPQGIRPGLPWESAEWDRALTPEEHELLSRDPWSLFRALPTRPEMLPA